MPHTADIAVELEARSETGLHQSGVDALRDLLVGTSPVTPAEEWPIEPHGSDPTERLIHFLADVLYLYDTERFVPVRVTGTGVAGERFDPARHHAEREVKAVTRHGARVVQDENGWRATVIFDV